LSTATASHSSRALAAPATLRLLLRELVDYAGLFPPAGVAMGDAVRNYARYRESAEAWALGRFVTPVARLHEFSAAYTSLPEQRGVWYVSALLGNNPKADFAAIAAFNHLRHGRVVIDAVEAKTATPDEVSQLARTRLPGVTAYCEVPLASAGHLLPVLRSAGLRAKIRAGGLTADAFPSVNDIAEFLRACAAERVAFKATAGLHHPLRSERPLTYEAGAVRGTMHGFLNVFLAAALAGRPTPSDSIRNVLLASDPTEFSFGETAVAWRDLSISLDELAQTRASFAISFGSCSFSEPISDLQELRLL
jgi:hypothetical protein